MLADVFHLYKGGSGFEGLRLLSGQAIQVIHLNDYPGNPPRVSISDRARVYPGDGVAPLSQILSALQQCGTRRGLIARTFQFGLLERRSIGKR